MSAPASAGPAPTGILTVKQFCLEYAVGHTRFHQLCNSGELTSHLNNRRRVVLRSDAERWANSLPIAAPDTIVVPKCARNRQAAAKAKRKAQQQTPAPEARP